MLPGHGEWIARESAHRSEQHIGGEAVIRLVLGRKLAGDPVMQHADALDTPPTACRLGAPFRQVEPAGERDDIGPQWFASHSRVPEVEGESMLLAARGAEHGIFSGDAHLADGQRVRGYRLEDLAPPDDIAQAAASPNAFSEVLLVFLWRKIVPRLEIACLVKDFLGLPDGRRPACELFGNQPASGIFGAFQDRRVWHDG